MLAIEIFCDSTLKSDYHESLLVHVAATYSVCNYCYSILQ